MFLQTSKICNVYYQLITQEPLRVWSSGIQVVSVGAKSQSQIPPWEALGIIGLSIGLGAARVVDGVDIKL